VLPPIFYEDVAEALAWLATTFGSAEHYRYSESNGAVQGAQMHLGDAWIMLTCTRADRVSPAQLGQHSGSSALELHDFATKSYARARSWS
jgi:uncharacterized glyoxalase superfamily protein PhnB